MKEINRFYIMGNKLPSDDGSIVSYKDHAAIVAAKDARIAALQEQVRVLAAESSNLKLACGGDGNYVDCPGCSHSQYTEAPETPATDAALREVRAQAVEGFSEFCGDNSVFIQATCNYDSLADAACIYLARILEGEQS